MFFDYSAEQQEFGASLRKVVADRAPMAQVRGRLGDAHDAGLWRLLCEDLVSFRDSAGRIGLVDAYCPHRRAPLFFWNVQS